MRKIPIIIYDFFLGEKRILTTDINDVFPCAGDVKDFPGNPAPQKVIDQYNKEGILILNPGVYDFYVESFCLHAGKYEPYSGSGYLIAPLKGRKSGIIKLILRNYAKRDDVSQKNVQGLIWAVLANEKYRNFSEDIKLTALKLLGKEDLNLLGKTFLDRLPKSLREKLWKRIQKKLPEEARKFLNRVEELKIKVRKAEATYEELEDIAVRFGRPPIPENMLEIKKGTWSQINNTCFVRIFPEGYRKTRVQIYVLPPGTTVYNFNLFDLVGVPANPNQQRLGFGKLSNCGKERDRKLTNQEGLEQIRATGHLDVNSEARTSLEGVRQSTIDGIIQFQQACGHDIVITGGTESGAGHAQVTYSHENGYKLDLRNLGTVTRYIKANFKFIGKRKNGDEIYRDAYGNEYCHEIHDPKKAPHWDVVYY